MKTEMKTEALMGSILELEQGDSWGNYDMTLLRNIHAKITVEGLSKSIGERQRYEEEFEEMSIKPKYIHFKNDCIELTWVSNQWLLHFNIFCHFVTLFEANKYFGEYENLGLELMLEKQLSETTIVSQFKHPVGTASIGFVEERFHNKSEIIYFYEDSYYINNPDSWNR